MRAYLRLLFLRTRRSFFPIAFGLPALGPTGIIFAATVFARAEPNPAPVPADDMFVIACLTATVAAVMVVANLTAFLVHEERLAGRSRALRLATIDGRPPVAAHLCFGSLLAGLGAAAGLCLPGVYAVALGLSVWVWLATTALATLGVTVAGAIGLWIGYLLPRTVAMVAVQMVSLWVAFGVGNALELVVKTRTLPLVALGWVALAHLVTMLALPPLWRRTSARLW